MRFKKLYQACLRQSPLFLVLLALGALHGLSFSDSVFPSSVLGIVQLLSWSLGIGLILHKSHSSKQAFVWGLLWGTGHFISAMYWIFISLHTFGQLASPLAAIALLLFCSGLALFPAAAIAFMQHWAHPIVVQLRDRLKQPEQLPIRAFLASAAVFALHISVFWTLAELGRGYVLTGLPWAMSGYAWVDTPLAGFAPLLGVYSITFLGAFIGAWCIVFVRLWAQHLQHKIRGIQRFSAVAFIAMSLPLLLGNMSKMFQWTAPTSEPLHFLLVQTNTSQIDKFNPSLWQPQQIAQQAQADQFLAQHPQKTDVIIYPETNLPMSQLALTIEDWNKWLALAQRHQSNVVISMMYADYSVQAFLNSALLIPADASPDPIKPILPSWLLRYNKHHLVPFGEFVPYGFQWFLDLVTIPMGSLYAGEQPQPSWSITDKQALVMNICYEDVFGENLIPALQQNHIQHPEQGNIHVNLSNLAWFIPSHATAQHLWMGRMRALETQTPVLRVSNSGNTAAIGAEGQIVARAPQYQTAELLVEMAGTKGLTPFSRWGNTPMLLSILCYFGILIVLRLRRAKMKLSQSRF